MQNSFKYPESLEILKSLLNDIPTAVLVVDKGTVVRMYNNSFQKLFVDNDNEVLGKYCGNAMQCTFAIDEGMDCGKSSACARCNLRNAFIQTLVKKEISKEKISKTYYLREKTLTRHFYYSTRVVNFEGEEMILVLIDDITELEEKNRALSELNEKKNEFMRIAAHDIRNPLSSVFTFSDLLINSHKEIPTEKQIEFLNHIKNSATFSLTLLNDLLDFSVLEAGKNQLNLKKNDFIELVKHITETYQYLAAPKKIKVSLFSHIRIEDFYFDENRIEQVLHNLLSNAIKYSPHNSEVTIKISKSQNYITTEVSDNGPGIDSVDIAKIFRPFHKGSAKTTGGEKSTGLGLSICKLIAQQHDGEIWAESTIGKGSTFYFKLPYKK